MRLIRQLVGVFAVLGVLFGALSLFTFDVIKIDWVTFMEVQPSYRPMENPLAVPARSIPVDGPISIPNMGAPENPIATDATSVARGTEFFMINCQMCHGATGEGNGPIAANILNKPANLTLDVTQSKSDGSLFLTISNGVLGRMPPMNENLTVRDRWDLVNFIRTLAAPK
jgi:mono/diheme cytochrome c family protein